MRDALPAPPSRPVLIAAIGNRFRSDDGVALAVADALEGQRCASASILHADNVLSLIDEWAGKDLVVLIDAMRSGAPVGSIRQIDAIAEPTTSLSACASSHEIGLAHTIEIARRLDRMPSALIVVGIEGGSFECGTELSPEVAAAVPRAAATVRAILETHRRAAKFR